MQPLNNNEENFNDNNSLSDIPGMATLKAISIFSFPFLRGEGLQEKRSAAKETILEIQEDIAALKENISLTNEVTETTPEVQVDNKLQEDIPMLTKAQGMVQHLKHTKHS